MGKKKIFLLGEKEIKTVFKIEGGLMSRAVY